MEVRTLEYFLDIAQTRNYSVSADRLNISQSSLSKAIIRLENELNVSLFDRKVHPIALTPAGECFYEDIKEMIPQYKRAIRHLRPYTARRRIGCCVVPNDTCFNLNYIIRTFGEENPDIRLESSNARELSLALQRMQAGELDFIICHQPLRLPAELRCTYLADDPLYVIVPREHPLADRRELSLPELSGQPLMETPFTTTVVRELEAHYDVRFPDIICRSNLRRDAVLSALPFENRVMICYGSDIDIFNLEAFSKIPIVGVKDSPYVLLEHKDGANPEYLRRFRSYLLKKAFPAARPLGGDGKG